MRVRILKAFVSRINNQVYRPGEGDEIEMPAGADWVRVGFAEPLEKTIETGKPPAARRKTAAKKKG